LFGIYLLNGLEDEDMADMPPFPFPKELFPPGTFPAGKIPILQV
jgi:hypothetical protein